MAHGVIFGKPTINVDLFSLHLSNNFTFPCAVEPPVEATGPNLDGPVPQRDWAYLQEDEEPTLGPELESIYEPGEPGAQWSHHEIASTRRRVLQMIHPNWDVKKAQGTWNGVGTVTDKVGVVVQHACAGASHREHLDEADFPRLHAVRG